MKVSLVHAFFFNFNIFGFKANFMGLLLVTVSGKRAHLQHQWKFG